MAHLFDPFTQRGLTLRNRIVVSPMCQYSSHEGFVNDWHLVHLGARAVGGAGLVLSEAVAVTPEGRISPGCLGIWDDLHANAFGRVVRFVKGEGAAFGLQLAHAGRKASTRVPWDGVGVVTPEHGGWQVVGPDTVPYSDQYPVPHALSVQEIAALVEAFAAAARRAAEIGVDVVEIHAAHGYLVHEFLSPRSNSRTDAYGGDFAGRSRLCLEVAAAVRAAWPEDRPLWVRLSATDWVDDGWTPEETVELARRLGALGVDLIDTSTGGNIHGAAVPAVPGFQVPFAARIRRDAAIATGAVGLITDPSAADAIVASEQADVVLLARELLRNPYWPLSAADALGAEVEWPPQYIRARPPR